MGAIGIMHGMHSQKTRAIIVGCFLIIGVIFTLGKIHYAINPLSRALLLRRFTENIKENNVIDPEQFWKFRDFYSATTSSFSPHNIDREKPFLTFKTSYMSSADYLLSNPSPIKLPTTSDVDTVIFQDDSSVVYAAGRKIYIRFIKPQSAMLRANGFFRYFGYDLEPYKDYKWYNETVINL